MTRGLLDWSNAIRLAMANDPGRQLFLDQLNGHGLLFLEDYLANIISGTKQEYVSDYFRHQVDSVLVVQ